MEKNFIPERPIGYIRVAAGGVNTVKTLQELIDADNVANGRGLNSESVTLALITPEVQSVRWRDDGVAPTAAIGYPLPVGAELSYTSRFPQNLQIISQVAGAVLNIALYAQ